MDKMTTKDKMNMECTTMTGQVRGASTEAPSMSNPFLDVWRFFILFVSLLLFMVILVVLWKRWQGRDNSPRTHPAVHFVRSNTNRSSNRGAIATQPLHVTPRSHIPLPPAYAKHPPPYAGLFLDGSGDKREITLADGEKIHVF